MKFSVGKIIWNSFSMFLIVVFWLFLIFALVFLFFIAKEEGGYDWNRFFVIFTLLISILSLATIVKDSSPWIQLFYYFFLLFLYNGYGHKALIFLLQKIDYNLTNFSWSLPEIIENFVGFSIQVKVIDFLFWYGFIFTILVIIIQVLHWFLIFLANKKVGFAMEIVKEQSKDIVGKILLNTIKEKYEMLKKENPEKLKILSTNFCPKCKQKIEPQDKFCRHCGFSFAKEESVKKYQFSKIEFYIRRIIGFVLLLSTLPIIVLSVTAKLFSLFGLSLITIFSIYLIKTKRHHLFFDVIFAFLAVIFYAFGGIGGSFGSPLVAPLVTLKGNWLVADWAHSGVGLDSGLITGYLVICVIILLFVSTAFTLFLVDIFAKIKVIRNSPKMNLISGIIFLIIGIIIFTLPWLHKIQISDSTGASGSPPGSGTVLSTTGSELKSKAGFDLEKGCWNYEIKLINTSQKKASITALKAKDIKGKTVDLAPPFDDNFQIIGGRKTKDKILIDVNLTIPIGPDEKPIYKPATLKISSQKPLILIAWIEENNKVGGNVSFWK